MKTLFIIRGVPGAGKTTVAEYICNTVYSADMYFEDCDGNYNFDAAKLKEAHTWCKSCVEEAMSLGSDIAVANTFTREWEMEDYFKLAKDYGYMVFSLIVENRHDGQNVHNVPEDTIDAMKNRFEVKL